MSPVSESIVSASVVASAGNATSSVKRGAFALIAEYVGRVREFTRTDWIVYTLWIGMMMGLVFTTGAFLIGGHSKGVRFPMEAWLVPVGAAIFALSIAIDTIGHRTIYKEALAGGEALVHHITIFCGVTSVIFLVLAYDHPGLWIVSMALTVLSFVYSLVDEVFHWRRYISAKADPVEMWSHVGIMTGHAIMMIAWWRFFQMGYPGVGQTIELLGLR
jgi:hypothetical protein